MVDKITAPITQTSVINKINEVIDANVVVDTVLSSTSTNPVQNKVIYGELTTKAATTDIGNAYLTIKRNGTAVGSFSANATSAVNIDITVPEATSTYSSTGTLPVNGTAVASALSTKSITATYTTATQTLTISLS